MSITANINGYSYTGPTLAEIVDREFGPDAFPAQDAVSGDPYWGKVLRQADPSSFYVEGIIRWVEGEEDIFDVGDALTELRCVSGEIMDLDSTRGRLVKQRNLLIRQVGRAGVPEKKIMDVTGLSRAQVSKIKTDKK